MYYKYIYQDQNIDILIACINSISSFILSLHNSTSCDMVLYYIIY